MPDDLNQVSGVLLFHGAMSVSGVTLCEKQMREEKEGKVKEQQEKEPVIED